MLTEVITALDGGWLPHSHTQSLVAKYITAVAGGPSAVRAFAVRVIDELDDRRAAHRFHAHIQEIRSREQPPLPHPEPDRR